MSPAAAADPAAPRAAAAPRCGLSRRAPATGRRRRPRPAIASPRDTNPDWRGGAAAAKIKRVRNSAASLNSRNSALSQAASPPRHRHRRCIARGCVRTPPAPPAAAQASEPGESRLPTLLAAAHAACSKWVLPEPRAPHSHSGTVPGPRSEASASPFRPGQKLSKTASARSRTPRASCFTAPGRRRVPQHAARTDSAPACRRSGRSRCR